jgi:hypothetical protein
MHDNTMFTKHLNLLIDCVKRIYAFTTVCLLCFLSIMRLCMICFECSSNQTPWFISLVLRPKTAMHYIWFCWREDEQVKMRYFSMNCRYFNFDDIAFSKTFIKLVISKFCETQCINTLSAFPLKYHSDKEQVKSDLINCDQSSSPS